ncbi:MAG TPA: 6,7-dimethyl-8-ribityllumazine synthase [Bacillota bacterium]
MAAAAGLRVGIAVAQFNVGVTERLLEGALGVCRQAGIDPSAIEILRVPGAFELPLAAQELARRGCEAVICLGAVIRGETPHFDYVCQQAAAGIMRVALDHHLPVGFGVLTCDTAEQAYARAGGAAGNKGAEAAQTALAMAALLGRGKGRTADDAVTGPSGG